jgi:dipeptidyl aminopeptidase/acylaminoacyl peptidase
LTDLPRGVESFAWAPDGRRIVVSTSSPVRSGRSAAAAPARAASAEADSAPDSDYHFVDRLGYLANGQGFVHHRIAHLWLVDVETGAARALASGPTVEQGAAWSPDGRRIAFAANRRRDHDLVERSDLFVADADSGRTIQITDGPMSYFGRPTWLPNGESVAALGHRFPAGAGSRNDIWLFAADGSDAGPTAGRNLSAALDLMPEPAMGSDLVPGEEARLAVSADGAWITVIAPIEGSNELWRISTGDGRAQRLTNGRHMVSSFDQVAVGGKTRLAFLRSDPTHLSDVHTLDVARGDRPRPETTARQLTHLNDDALAGIELTEPETRWVEVDGRRIQGWYYPAASVAATAAASKVAAAGSTAAPKKSASRTRGATARPLVTEIHGGPHTMYGNAPMWEFQVLAGAGMSVWASNPRGSTGYGQDFNAANHRDWGDGPMRDVLAGIDVLVADGLADPDRLGLTGGSYGGYLTNWTIARDQRFRAAFTARSVSDMTTLMLTGDISGGEFGRQEFGVAPWDDPDYYRAISPLTYASQIRTPLLIQHSENDIRTTIAQAEALFTVLRSLRRPVRLMRVPGETHELTRSGTPFRRVENLVQVRDWFRHYLVAGKRGLPPLPKVHAGS